MVIKINNKCEKFYEYMGRFFGSRLVQRQTNDRIYDDNNKEWYIYIKDDKVLAFVSVHNNIIKNVYGVKEEYVIEVLKQVQKEIQIAPSIVTSAYEECYEKSGLKMYKGNGYVNFLSISA